MSDASSYTRRTPRVRTIVKIVVHSLLSNRPLDEPLPTHFFLEAARFFLGFSAAHAHARLRLSRIERVGHSGRTAGLMGEGGADALASPTAYDMGRNRLGGGGGRAAPFGGGGF